MCEIISNGVIKCNVCKENDAICELTLDHDVKCPYHDHKIFFINYRM